MAARYNEAVSALPMPDRVRSLPVSPEGYPVPWFVPKIAGQYDLRYASPEKLVAAVQKSLCWVCGQTMGVRRAMAVGPMCLVNRVSSEPPMHRECAEYSAKVCPFLTRPRMRRNEADEPADKVSPPGAMNRRNPGVVAVWVAKEGGFKVSRAQGGWLFHMVGRPDDLTFWAEGRQATAAEVRASLDSGLPFLQDLARKDGLRAMADLDRDVAAARQLIEERCAA